MRPDFDEHSQKERVKESWRRFLMQPIDLSGPEALKQKQFTVLTNPNGFGNATINRLIVSVATVVYFVPEKPNDLIIQGAITAERLETHLPPGTTVKVIVGFENPELPFQPSIFS